jgi:hypothetical protein
LATLSDPEKAIGAAQREIRGIYGLNFGLKELGFAATTQRLVAGRKVRTSRWEILPETVLQLGCRRRVL